MKSILAINDRILIVGDGDFSFTLSLVKHSAVTPCQVFTSNLETESSILHHAQAAHNMESLKEQGVSVFLEVDACFLHNHSVISKEQFDRIIFNFPLADRHNIKKNRALLADFFLSCKSVLAPDGKVLVTLCKGQGGTPADQPIRSWHDSWQVVAMAANASFLLSEVLQFDSSDFPEYHSVGFRFQDKSFHVSGAITHVFEQGSNVDDDSHNTRGVVVCEGNVYSCSHYVMKAFERDLVREKGNPLCILRENLEQAFYDYGSNQFNSIENCSLIVPSHKTLACCIRKEKDISSKPSAVTSEELNINENCNRNSVTDETIDMNAVKKTSLAHGVVNNHDMNNQNLSPCQMFLPTNQENVYVLVKKNDDSSLHDTGVGEENQMETTTNTSDSIFEEIEAFGNNDTVSSNHFSPNCRTQAASSSPSLVSHVRVSLLENLLELCNILNKKPFQDYTHQNSYANPEQDPTSLEPCETRATTPFVLSSGSCMVPCPINPDLVPVRHEMIIVHHLSFIEKCGNLSHNEVRNRNKQAFHKISSSVLSVLQASTSNTRSVSRTDLNLSISDPSQSESEISIRIDGVDKTETVGEICLHKVAPKSTVSIEHNISSTIIGRLLHCQIGDVSYHVSLIDLQKFALTLCAIHDWRLLWSQSPKFFHQFIRKESEYSQFFLHHFHAFSLYPMKFAHDLSFWECNDESESNPTDQNETKSSFEETKLFDTIRNVCGDLVSCVNLLDVYEDPVSKRRSRCYRLYFMSPDQCLSYSTSWKIQSLIRMEVARSLRVKLR